MQATTLKFLQAQVDRINRTAGTPLEPWADSKAQIGNYHLDGAYGGYALHQMGNESGGIRDVFRCGHVTKRELSNRISAFLVGLETR
jgi:hypothetical protein